MLANLLLVDLFFHLIFSSSPVSLYQKGIKFLEESKYQESVDVFLEAVKQNPYYADAWKGLGKAFFYLGNYKASIDAISNALKLKEYDLESKIFLGKNLEAMGYTNEAYKLYQELYLEYKHNPEVLLSLIKLKIAKGFLDEAEKLIKRAKIVFPKDYRVYLLEWKLLRERRNLRGAVLSLKKAFELNSRSKEVLFALAEEWYFRRDYQKAKKFLDKVLFLYPKFEPAILLKARISFAVNDFQTSENLFSDMYSKHSDNVQYLIGLVLSKLKLGKTNESLDILTDYLKRYPSNEFVRFFTEEVARKGTPLNSSVRKGLYDYRIYRSGLKVLSGDIIGGQYELKRAIKVLPFDKTARLKMVNLWLLRGFKLRALKDLEVLKRLFEGDVFIGDLYEKVRKEIIKEKGGFKIDFNRKVIQWGSRITIGDEDMINTLYLEVFKDLLIDWIYMLNNSINFEKNSINLKFSLNIERNTINLLIKNKNKKILFKKKYRRRGFGDVVEVGELVAEDLGKWIPRGGFVEKVSREGGFWIDLGRFDGITNGSLIYTVPPDFDFDKVFQKDFVSHETNKMPVFKVVKAGEYESFMKVMNTRGKKVDVGWWGLWLPEEFIKSKSAGWVEWRR